MRFTVESWAPEYGVPSRGEEPATTPEVGVELPPEDWRPLLPEVGPADEVTFVDGVRRMDAAVWIEQPDGYPVLGLCASYAAGVVRCNHRAEMVEARVERGLFTAAADAGDITTTHGVYRVRATAGHTPEELAAGIQHRMGELEGAVADAVSGGRLVVVDGPLSHRRFVAGAVGYVKTHHVRYLPEALTPVLANLPAGRRTPLFLMTTAWSRYSWYLRLTAGSGPISGIVRCEVAADGPVGEVALLADLVTATLPRFASRLHKDPRAPQNLYPIGGLERTLRHRLGDPMLLARSLRVAAR